VNSNREIIKEHRGTAISRAIQAEISELSKDAATEVLHASSGSDIERIRLLSGRKMGIDAVLRHLMGLETSKNDVKLS